MSYQYSRASTAMNARVGMQDVLGGTTRTLPVLENSTSTNGRSLQQLYDALSNDLAAT